MSLLTSLQAHATALGTLEPTVRDDAPDAVHQMRVAARTLRANLRTFADVLPGTKRRTALIGELGWLGDALGPAREAEVLSAQVLALLERTPPEYVLGPVRQRVQAVFELERESALGLVGEALDSPRYRRLLKDLDVYVASVKPDTDADLSRLHRRVRTRMRAALPMPHGTDRDLAMHEARKAARKARYAAEALGRPAKPIKALQDVLGDEHDRVVAASALSDLAAGAYQAGENAFTYGVLLGLVRCDSRDFDRRVDAAWRKVKPSLRDGRRRG
ncbi:CHAD domain-containing protein [Catenulispora pinisilvae]|uniref:CHAD domain-containing protein n=1 Tax=Catenulispora pinisilvae TaxID=2705253 RepID=UPI001892847A|nr:CHAD domain-containing protein [Catenulispora pinisilvae]